jgi:hypothetical protein
MDSTHLSHAPRAGTADSADLDCFRSLGNTHNHSELLRHNADKLKATAAATKNTE